MMGARAQADCGLKVPKRVHLRQRLGARASVLTCLCSRKYAHICVHECVCMLTGAAIAAQVAAAGHCGLAAAVAADAHNLAC